MTELLGGPVPRSGLGVHVGGAEARRSDGLNRPGFGGDVANARTAYGVFAAVQGAAAIRTAGRSGTAQTACPKGIAPERRSSRHNAIRWRAGSAGSRGNNSSHRHSRSKCSAFTPRPYQTHPWLLVLASRTSDFSFPSDHAVMAGAVAAGLLLVSRLTGPTPREIGGQGADCVRRTRRDDRGDRPTRRCCASSDDHRRTPDGVRGGAVVCRSNQPSGRQHRFAK